MGKGADAPPILDDERDDKMRFAILTGGALFAPLISIALAAADEPAARTAGSEPTVLAFQLPGVETGAPRTAEVQLVQAADPRIAQIEERLRELTGRIEELNFQILQMQDQMQRTREDNEFRFQQLEGGGSAGGAQDAAPSGDRTDNATSPDPAETAAAETDPAGSSAATAAPPRALGQITFDGQGNVTGGQIAPQVAPQPGTTAAGASDETTVAALPQAGGAEQLYRNSYDFILSGDYSTAEAGFRELIERFPESENIADAHFWLGEALLGQERYRDAAEVLLAASQDYPQSRRAPEMLFKLGVSLAALDQREVACATFDEVGQRYPDMSAALKDRIEQEKSLTSC